MPIYKKRIAFGSEQRLQQPGKARCTVCASPVGDPHEVGCEAEECPLCRTMLIGCCCAALSPHESERIIAALYRRFPDLESALQSVGASGCGAPGSSYLQHAVMRYIFEHVPDEAREEIVRVFHLRFPGLVPQLQDEEGRGYYTAEQLAQALDVSVGEINERIEAMIAAGDGVATGIGRKLRKVH